jgi:hypothetical protein
MNDFLYFYLTCKTIYEIVRHRVRPPAEPVCEGCQQIFRSLKTASGSPTGAPALDLTTQRKVIRPSIPAAVVCRGIRALYVRRNKFHPSRG